MLFHSPRERHQLPLNTFADMASKSTQWIIKTKTVTLPKETGSWARKCQRIRAQALNRGVQSPLKCFYYSKPCVWNQEKSEPWDRLKPTEFTDLYKSPTGSREQSSCRYLPCCHTSSTISSVVVWKSSWGRPSAASILATITPFRYEAFWVSPESLGRPC